MNRRTTSLRRLLALASLWLVPLLWAQPLAAAEAQREATKWFGGDNYQRSLRTYAVPDVVLTDADAKPVRLRELLASDDPVMMNFVFTTCSTICPIMVRVFAEVPSRLGATSKRLRMISISVDPENDTPKQLKTYAAHVGAGPRWQFLTGTVQDVRAVQAAFDNFRGDKMNHEPLTLLRQTSGRPWVRIDGFAGPDELASEVRKIVPQ